MGRWRRLFLPPHAKGTVPFSRPNPLTLGHIPLCAAKNGTVPYERLRCEQPEQPWAEETPSAAAHSCDMQLKGQASRPRIVNGTSTVRSIMGPRKITRDLHKVLSSSSRPGSIVHSEAALTAVVSAREAASPPQASRKLVRGKANAWPRAPTFRREIRRPPIYRRLAEQKTAYVSPSRRPVCAGHVRFSQGGLWG
jgi:hypothetical protein